MRHIALLLILPALALAEKLHSRYDFEDRDLSRWILPVPSDWQIASENGNHFLRLGKPGQIGDPRRPLQYALRKDLCAAGFDLRVKLRRTAPSKSVLVTFGYQDTLHFYYAHLSSDSGDVRVHNGLFKVDGGERFRIAGEGSAPVLPDQQWHEIRIVHEVSTGKIEVYVDKDTKPRFRHNDTSFRFGRIGVGSFNETGDYDDLRLDGQSSSECR